MMPATTRARRITLSEVDRHGADARSGDDFQSLRARPKNRATLGPLPLLMMSATDRDMT